jgi:hypothetical protein
MAGAGDEPRSGSSALVHRWLAVGTFVLGVLVGGVLVGLLSGGSGYAGEVGAVPTDARDGGALPQGIPTSGQAVVDAACLRALNAAQDVSIAVDDLGRVAGGVDPAQLDAAQLDEAIRRLEPLQSRLRENLASCRVVPTTSSPGATATPPSSAAAPTR